MVGSIKEPNQTQEYMVDAKRSKLIPFEEIKDNVLGKKGTADRDEYEFEVSMILIANSIKELRKKKKLTQAELGELVGVKKSQVSKIE